MKACTNCGNAEVRVEFDEETDINGMFLIFPQETTGAPVFNLYGLLDHISLAVAVKVHRTDTPKMFAEAEFSCGIHKNCNKMFASHY